MKQFVVLFDITMRWPGGEKYEQTRTTEFADRYDDANTYVDSVRVQLRP